MFRRRRVLSAGPRHTAGMWLAQMPEADTLLGSDPLALVFGMLLDQQMLSRSSDQP
jgi:hypothetical protein